MSELIVMRLSPPEEGDEENWEVCGYHMGQYPIFAKKEDAHGDDTSMDKGTVYERG